MTPQEQALLNELFDRLAKLEGNPRDPSAERLIADGLRRAPHAVYALVQTTLVQDEALKRAETREVTAAHGRGGSGSGDRDAAARLDPVLRPEEEGFGFVFARFIGPLDSRAVFLVTLFTKSDSSAGFRVDG